MKRVSHFQQIKAFGARYIDYGMAWKGALFLAVAVWLINLEHGAVAALPAAGTGQGVDVAATPLSTVSSKSVPQAQDPAALQDAALVPAVHEGPGLSVLLSTNADGLDEADQAVFDAFRTAAIDELRRTPGLALVLADSAAPEQAVDYELTLSAERRDGQLNGMVRVRNTGPNAVVRPIRGAFGTDCAPACFQVAARLGEALARTAAAMMRPPAAAQRPALLADLQDTSLPPQQRLDALRDLDLRRPIYRQTASYGHFGRDDIELPWEDTGRAQGLRAAAGLAQPMIA